MLLLQAVAVVSLIATFPVSSQPGFTFYQACGKAVPVAYCVQAGFLNENPSFIGPQKVERGKFRCFDSAGEIKGQCCPKKVNSNKDPKTAVTVPKEIAKKCFDAKKSSSV
ncbi:hypothetical protein PGTUg99_015352 [Puccinia graminis f. sp. tritici]|uniref:Uncharacterized protein n=1 Tax=Puccinia graminis f. sp. tritici TaxID=56615 RepID=A0A5B0QGI4_PUCGR|nr:hypothetical protein PGTUg99_015352 [Puccinia graminis f. sp. tritici]